MADPNPEYTDPRTPRRQAVNDRLREQLGGF